jgi:CRP/FNR family transcriptional regulator
MGEGPKTDVIRGFVRGLSPGGRARLDASLRRHAAAAGERVICRGDRVAGVYLVERGLLRVFHSAADGGERTLYRLRRGDACVLALNAAFTGMAYPADVAAEEDASIVVVPGDTWRALFDDEPSVRALTVKLLASWVHGLLGVLDAAVSTDVATRLADELIERMGPDGRVHATHATLARHLGTAREVVSRVLGDWRRRGIVDGGRGWIEVVDAGRLPQADG